MFLRVPKYKANLLFIYISESLCNRVSTTWVRSNREQYISRKKIAAQENCFLKGLNSSEPQFTLNVVVSVSWNRIFVVSNFQKFNVNDILDLMSSLKTIFCFIGFFYVLSNFWVQCNFNIPCAKSQKLCLFYSMNECWAHRAILLFQYLRRTLF